MLIELILTISLMNSFDSLRFVNSQKQSFDTSCGYSVAATVMHDWYGEDVDELSLIASDLKLVSDNKETDYKVSLKKLKDLFSAHGYTAKAFSLDYSSLMNAVRKYPPVIARYDEGDGHFVLVLSGDDNKVIISNPSTGTNAMYSADFKKIFSGKTLLVHSEEKTLKTEVLNQMIAETERRIEFLENLERFLP